MALLSLRAYGTMRGVSGEAVRKAIKDGRIKNGVRYDDKGRPKIDPAIADAEWVRNTDSRRQTQIEEGSRLDASQQPPGVTGKDEAGLVKGAVPEIAKSNAILLAYKARLAKLEYDEKAGKVVPIEQVAQVVEAEYTRVRARLLAIPSRIAQEALLMQSIDEMRELIEAAITDALQELTGDVKRADGNP